MTRSAAEVEVEVLVYTTQELCTALRVSEHYVRIWTNRVERPLPHYTAGDRTFYPKDLVKQWLVEEAAQQDSYRSPVELSVAGGTTQRAVNIRPKR